MKQSELRHYAPLYTAARYYGADRILLEWLGEKYRVLPLLLPHGVEFPGQFQEPGDIRRIEPIYWATNRDLHNKAVHIKPSVLLPHPLLLSPAFARSETAKRSGALIVGAPPGQTNDRNMLACLRDHGVNDGTILIKRRTGWEGSEKFWRAQGYRTTTFGDPFEVTYDDMAMVFSSYEEVLSTTVSSAVFFAAACGAKVTLLRGCSFEAYELLDVTKLIVPHNPEGCDWINRFANAAAGEQRKLALEMLGDGLSNKERVRAELSKALEALQQPLFLDNPRYPKMLMYVQAWLAMKLGRSGLASIRPSLLFRAFSKPKIGVLTMKNIDFYLDGPSPQTYSLTPIRYRRGATEPGHAIDPY